MGLFDGIIDIIRPTCPDFNTNGPSPEAAARQLTSDEYFLTYTDADVELAAIRAKMGLTSPEKFQEGQHHAQPRWISDLVVRKARGETLSAAQKTALETWKRHPDDPYRAELAMRAAEGKLTPIEREILNAYVHWETISDQLLDRGTGSDSPGISHLDQYVVNEAAYGFRRIAYLEALEKTDNLNPFTAALLRGYQCHRDWYRATLDGKSQVRALTDQEIVEWESRQESLSAANLRAAEELGREFQLYGGN